MRLKKIIILIICSGFICLSLLTSILIYRRIHLSKPYLFKLSTKNENKTNSLLVLGDSWAYHSKERNCVSSIDSIFQKSKKRCTVEVKGVRGVTSRYIYENILLQYLNELNSNNRKIPKFTLVLCGINDQNGQYGYTFYAYHTCQIFEELIANGSRPIYLELPNWKMEQQYERYNTDIKFIYSLLSFITSQTLQPTKTLNIYRRQLRKEIIKRNLSDKIDIIAWDEIEGDSIWNDYLHLNKYGYTKLSNAVIKRIFSKTEKHEP